MILIVKKITTTVVFISIKLIVDQTAISITKKSLFNQNQKQNSQYYITQKNQNLTPISSVENHTIQHSNQTDLLHTKAYISPRLKTNKNSEKYTPVSLRKSTYYSIYHFIGKLTERQETIVSSDVCNKLDALILLKVEYELHNLPEIKL